MIALAKGIRAKWLEATAILPDLWLDIPKDAAAFPYGVMSFPSDGTVRQFFGNQQDEEIVVRFTVHHTDLEALGTLQASIHSRYDYAKLDLSAVGGGTNFHFVREGQSLRATQFQSADGKTIYRSDSVYRTKTSL